MTSHKYLRSLSYGVIPVLLAAGATRTQAQTKTQFGPDLVQTLGVGAGAVGMGGAYSTLVNDVTATFWNSAQLSVITRSQTDFEMRSVSQDVLRLSGSTASPASAVSDNMGKPQVSFLGFAYPLRVDVRSKGDTDLHPRSVGVLGISYSLGGYANLLKSYTGFLDSVQLTSTTGSEQTLVRNSFINIDYGNKFEVAQGRGSLRAGVGIYVVDQSYYQATNTTVTNNAVLGILPSVTDTAATSTGYGEGYILGVTYQLQNRKVVPQAGTANSAASKKTQYQSVDEAWSFSGTFRSGTGISGLGNLASEFNSELPSRIELGTAYQSQIAKHVADKAKPKIYLGDIKLAAAEIQRLGQANIGELDARRPVTDYHVGIEFRPHWSDDSNRSTPIRLGFRTVSNADATLFSYDDAISLGFAYQSLYSKQVGPRYSIEGALEYFTHSSLVQYTLSARLRF